MIMLCTYSRCEENIVILLFDGGRWNPSATSLWYWPVRRTLMVLSQQWGCPTGGATRWFEYGIIASMAMSRNLAQQTRASPGVDLRHSHQSNVRNMRGLPTQGRSKLKKLAPSRFATINIGTLTSHHHESFKTRWVDTECIQETKWKGSNAKEIEEGYKIIYNGTSSVINRMAVLISQCFHNKVTEIKRLPDQLISIKIESESIISHLIFCYARQTGYPDIEKDDFWESFEMHLRTIAPEDHIILGGDLNGHVGEDSDGYMRCHGGHGLGVRNDDILESVEPTTWLWPTHI